MVAIGAKTVETRSWKTKYRGRLAIHAAAGYPAQGMELAHNHPQFRLELEQAGYTWGDSALGGKVQRWLQLPLGRVLATVDLVECVPTELACGEMCQPLGHHLITYPETKLVLTKRERLFGDYSPGRFAWLLENVVRLPRPVPARGFHRLWGWRA